MNCINDLIDNSLAMQSTWQTVVSNAKLEFSGEARLQIFTQKWLLGNIKYFVSFKLESLESNGLKQNITLSKHWPLTNELFASLDLSLTLETSGMGKNEKCRYIAFSSFYPKIKSITYNIWCLSTKLASLLQFGPVVSKYGRFLYAKS